MDTFIARQPIFDMKMRAYGYELLFRSGLENVFRHPDPNQASSKVISDTFFLHDLASLTRGRRAFINITRDLLLEELLFLIPKEKLVVEILENVPPDEEVVRACEKLKRAGYLLAMDDFVYDERYQPLIRLADFIKVDFLATKEAERRELVERLSPSGVRFLAEKIETVEMFREAKALGYSYCQGYFFSRPKVISGKDIPGLKLHYLHLLQEIHRPELDFPKLTEIVRREVSLSYKLLRYINSAFFGLRNKISSLKQALLLLGEREIRKWITLVTLATLGEDKPEEIVLQSILRAKFCESLAGLSGLSDRSDDLFLMGMFSMIDGLLDRPLSEILEGLPIAEEIKGALLGEENRLGGIYQYLLAYEQGRWERLSELGDRLRIDETKVSSLYLEAVRWSSKFLAS
ncbi:MAG: HDOD domain-containing protein [Desulfobacterota bacterium]|nr:HDOD domain-containing protein [Thermodesulfobacteriota bacterium]